MDLQNNVLQMLCGPLGDSGNVTAADIARAQVVSVADITLATEMASVVGTVVGELRFAVQTVAGGNNLSTLYQWDSTGAVTNAPVVIASTGGSWIAVAGYYAAQLSPRLLSQITSGSDLVVNSFITVDPSGASTASCFALSGQSQTVSTNAQNLTATATPGLVGVQSSVNHFGSGTVSAMAGLLAAANARAGGGPVTRADSVRTIGQNLGANTVASLSGVRVQSSANTGGGTITVFHGLYVDAQTAAGTNYAIFTAGAGLVSIFDRSFLGQIAGTFKGNVLAGVQDATAAIAGQVGEVISSTVTAAAVAATGTVGNVTSITLTAGDWLISAFVNIAGGATGLTAGSTAKASVVTTTATNGVNGSTMAQSSVEALVANGLKHMAIPQVRVNIAATTTYFLTEEVTYAAGSPTVAGIIIATRMR